MQMSPSTPPSTLTTTSYAVLSLLGVQDWSAYELVREMERGWYDIWPRAISGVYREPKKLVDHGYATNRVEYTGERARTIYSITPEGRAALRDWFAQPADDPKLEAEVVLRAAFAEYGTVEDLLAAVHQVRAFAVARSRVYLAIGDEYRETGPRFPERLHSIMLVGGFLARYFAALVDWADWVEAEVDAWSGVTSTDAVPDLHALMADVRRRFEANAARSRSSAGAC